MPDADLPRISILTSSQIKGTATFVIQATPLICVMASARRPSAACLGARRAPRARRLAARCRLPSSRGRTSRPLVRSANCRPSHRRPCPNRDRCHRCCRSRPTDHRRRHPPRCPSCRCRHSPGPSDRRRRSCPTMRPGRHIPGPASRMRCPRDCPLVSRPKPPPNPPPMPCEPENRFISALPAIRPPATPAAVVSAEPRKPDPERWNMPG